MENVLYYFKTLINFTQLQDEENTENLFYLFEF